MTTPETSLVDLPVIDPNTARIDGIVARSGRLAVIFRRGPSRRVRLLVWDLATDKVTPGQWFKGRIYARRCDLSPDGELLAYFAASFRKPLYSWTAISRPPWLTALALWPKGDCWGGGALFESTRCLKLNHRAPGKAKSTAPDQVETDLAPGFRTPKGFRVEPLHEHAGWGEDDPIYSMRLVRDGWRYAEHATSESESGKDRFWVRFVPPIVRRKNLGRSSQRRGLALRVSLHAMSERHGRWYVETAAIVDDEDQVVAELGRVDWAETDLCGGVLLAREGCLFRLRKGKHAASPELVADLNPMAFEAIASPVAVRRW